MRRPIRLQVPMTSYDLSQVPFLDFVNKPFTHNRNKTKSLESLKPFKLDPFRAKPFNLDYFIKKVSNLKPKKLTTS